MRGASLQLRNVTKRFGDVAAVRDLTLQVGGGTFLTLLGPSGCGKTTTLNMIAGFETPDEGSILLGERSLVHLPPYKRPVNTVFQGYALFPHLDVAGNVAFGLRMKKVPKAEIEDRVKKALDVVQLGEMIHRGSEELSGGQQQRVALARALVNEPDVLLLDEPLSALDAQLRKQMQIELKAIQRELGITFVYVTHDQEEALVMSDVVCVMNEGRLEQVGSPKDLYERPETAFVARFLGRNNFLRGRSVPAAGGFRLDMGDGRSLDVPGLNAEGDVLVAIRPEKLSLAESDHGRRNLLGGTVVATRFLGDRLEVTVQVDPALRLTLYANGGKPPPETGGTVAVEVPAEHCRVLGA